MDEIWRFEERFWLAGLEHYETGMHPECIMAFPAPVGILTGATIIESLKHAPRWSSVEMGERQMIRPAPDAVVVAYRARAVRDGYSAYSAYCTSTHVRVRDGWRLVQHHQTPA